MKNVIRVVLTFYPLQEGIQLARAPIKLRPEIISKHIRIGIVDVATLVIFVRVRSAGMRRSYFLRVEVSVEIAHPLQAARVFICLLPILLELNFHDRGAL